MPSKALEVNIATSRVEVSVDPKYNVVKRVMEKYYGIKDGLETFLTEICHPYKNWSFVVQETRSYSLNYLHVLKAHPEGPAAAGIYIDIFFQAIDSSRVEEVRINAADNLLLFIHRIIKDLGADFPGFFPILHQAFDRMANASDECFFLFVKSFYQLNKIGKTYLQAVPQDTDFKAVNRLLIRYYRTNFNYWLKKKDPLTQFENDAEMPLNGGQLREIFVPISHKRLKEYQESLESIVRLCGDGTGEGPDKLLEFPGYGQIVSFYSRMPQKIMAAIGDADMGNQLKLIFLLQMMNISGLSSTHEETLRDINRILSWLIQHEDDQVIQRSLEKTFEMLRMSAGKFPATALNCVLNMGRGVYKTDNSDLVDFFMDSVVSLGFQAPELRGVGDDWQIRVNPVHIQNIRVWLELIQLNPKWSKKLLSSLIIHLSLTGVFIKDTDLFPRDITELLNSDISPVYNLVKQLTRLFPAYFNDIGAEGALREISTEIDEICQRKDVLVHFLRKQSHVESSNQIIGLMEGVLEFWRTGAKEGIAPFVPPHIYEQIGTERQYVDGVHLVLNRLFKDPVMNCVTDLLHVDKDRFKALTADLSGVSEQDLKRVELALDLYRRLYQKYHLGYMEMGSYLGHLNSSGLPDLDKLKKALTEKRPKRKVKALLSYLEKLKGIILSFEDFEIREDIYRKRHFTVDIPSMYGSYHELKFDALGLTFRLESIVNVLFEEIVNTFNLAVITRATISRIYEYLRLFDIALRLDGIFSMEMERQLDILAHALEIRSFTATQYLDIFRGFSQALNNIVNDYFNNVHQENLFKALEDMPIERLMSKYRPRKKLDRERLAHRVTEVFLRDRIASSLGLQQLDLLLSRILNTLYRQLRELPKERVHLLLGSDPQKGLTPIYPIKKGIRDIIHLGNKGLNLVKMKHYGLPVPPAFIITTEVFRCREIIDQYAPAKENFNEQVGREISRLEELTDRKFGDPKKPLLFSVRSGSAISQPGMMATFLNVGINEEIVQGIISLTKNEWFAWDTYRRFLQSYGMAFDLSRDDFDDVIGDFKHCAGIPLKRDLSGKQMKDVAMRYKRLILDNGIKIEEAPFEQLYIAVTKVFDSWSASKAKTYRKIMGISDDWGTAVTVQSMIFGNYSPQSGTGVFFTHNPRWSGDMIMPWGDYTCGNQGEDVVSGLVNTMPISKNQAQIENRSVDSTLEVKFPEIYRALRQWAKKLIYEKEWGPQEMEFTFEGPETNDLYFLQTRDMVIRERRKSYSFDLEERGPAELLAHGIGVSGGAMSGRVVFSLGEIRHWRKVEPNTWLIVVRGDTVPDDIKEIYEADGLLTARGGSTSHAAIVAHRLGKTCVVGCSNLVCNEKESTCAFDQKVLKSGGWISIDGLEGSVYLGQITTKETGGGNG